jgi:hypothetical protein
VNLSRRPPPLLLPRSRAMVCLPLWPRALTWAASLPLLPLPPGSVRCARVHVRCWPPPSPSQLFVARWEGVCAVAHVVWGQSLDGRTTSCTRARLLSYHPNRPPPPSYWWGITLPCKLLEGGFLGVVCPPCSPGVNSCQHRPPELFTRVCCVRCAHGLPMLFPPPLSLISPQPPQVREAPGRCLDWATPRHHLCD